MTRDGLTGLPMVEDVALALVEGAAPFGVFVDIDGLAHATHHFGYAHSDEVIVRVAEVVAGACRGFAQSQVFRIDGDEFLAIVPEASHGDALDLARSIIAKISALGLEYARRDVPSRRHVTANAVVSRVTAALAPQIRAVREWSADHVWRAKAEDAGRTEVVVDAGESLPAWAD
jgi:diguanylate cyclase (GGDEF)-like protein